MSILHHREKIEWNMDGLMIRHLRILGNIPTRIYCWLNLWHCKILYIPSKGDIRNFCSHKVPKCVSTFLPTCPCIVFNFWVILCQHRCYEDIPDNFTFWNVFSVMSGCTSGSSVLAQSFFFGITYLYLDLDGWAHLYR